MTLRDLVLRLRALAFPRRVEQELDEELAFHIEREAQQHIAHGLSPAEARREARARFGAVSLTADQCRDARGTSGIEDLTRDVLYACRTMTRAPLVALTIVATVALGLGLVTVVFTFYNFGFLRVDAVRNPGELFAVLRPVAPGKEAWLPFTRRDYEAMRAETSVFTDLVATIRPVRARLEGRSVSFALVTGNFFQTLGVSPVLGRPLTPQDDERDGARPVIALSHRGWQKLFAGDPGVIGRSVRINGLPYEVVGVMPEDFRGLAIGPPDYWAPLGLVSQFREAPAGGADGIAVDVIGRLREGISVEAAADSLTAWVTRRAGPDPSPRNPAAITLAPRRGTLSADVVEIIAVTVPLFVAFGLILLIGCANVANLQLARGVARQREIGIRLSLGASRQRVVRQLLTESLLLALVAAACGFAVSRLFQEGAMYAVTATMPVELVGQIDLGVLPADWRVFAFLVGGAVVATLFFGLAPALQSTRVDLVRSMRGEMTRDARPWRARQLLIAIQVGASALLLVCSGVLLRSTMDAADVDPGVRTGDTMILFTISEPRRAAILQAVASHQVVAAVAASSRRGLGVAAASSGTEPITGTPAETSKRTPVEWIAASPDYFEVLDLRFVSGRGFTPAERSTDARVAVVTETIARELWPAGSAVGQVLRLDVSDPPGASQTASYPFMIVGVLRDVNGPLEPDLFPSRSIYVPTTPEAEGTALTLRVRGEPEQARQVLLDDLMRVDPGLGEITTMRSLARMQSYVLGIAFWVAVVLGGLALVLTVSGLFSVLSYLVEQRAKDIGVHLALGATTRDAAGLVISKLLRPVSIGLAAGVGLAAAVATMMMAATDAEVGRLIKVFDPGAYMASLLIIVLSCLLAAAVPALRAARIDPIATLRQD
jgi:predicted permease